VSIFSCGFVTEGSVLPMHGAKRDLPTGLVEGIKRQLGLKGGGS